MADSTSPERTHEEEEEKEAGALRWRASEPASKDPRTKARGYQLMLSKKAVEQNIVVYLGTGCGKTHIAVLLIYELRHLIQKPQNNVCIFLAPTVHLVRQQAMVIEDSTNFNVGIYFGKSKCLKNHHDWEKEIELHEVLVMTPQILLHNLEHCFIRMEQIALLIFDECHHAQSQNRHAYVQIMKDFYKACTTKRPRIFGMTASPVVGKGGCNAVDYSKSINSLESLLDAKVCSVEGKEELEGLVASADVKVYYYGPVIGASNCIVSYMKRLEEIKNRCMSIIREKFNVDPKDMQKKIKLLWRLHENLIFCLQNLGIWGAIRALSIVSSDDRFELSEMIETDDTNDTSADMVLDAIPFSRL